MGDMTEELRPKFNEYMERVAPIIFAAAISRGDFPIVIGERGQEDRKKAAQFAHESAQALWAENRYWRIPSPQENAVERQKLHELLDEM